MSRFRFEYLNLTQLGELFGVSSHKVGDWLVQIGFRTENKRPSKHAFEEKVVAEGPSRGVGTYNWVWHAERTVAALEAAGHRRVFPVPTGLAEPPSLVGPFTLKIEHGGNFRIENESQQTVLLGQGEENGRNLLKVLTAADRLGYLGRCGVPSGESVLQHAATA